MDASKAAGCSALLQEVGSAGPVEEAGCAALLEEAGCAALLLECDVRRPSGSEGLLISEGKAS